MINRSLPPILLACLALTLFFAGGISPTLKQDRTSSQKNKKK